jgi:pimeloyl-ACP methyl ester carboxylesterase
MAQAQIKAVQCLSPSGLHRMAYKEWGDPLNPKVLICVHGLTRVSDDFDYLAQEMSTEYRVVCPDVTGRGRSDWLTDPCHYVVPQYVSDMVTLLARLNAENVHWFGTSMGGLIGMGLASLKNSPVDKLVLNDIGPRLDPTALARIGDYVGVEMRFPDVDAAIRYTKEISLPFGPHSEEEWRKLASDVVRQDTDGKWIFHYDPRLAIPFKESTPESIRQGEALLWMAYDAISCPTLVVRGAQSDLLGAEIAKEMTSRGPKARLVEISEVGHAPTFVHADQIALVKDFLLD